MLTIEVGTLVYNHIQRGIILELSFSQILIDQVGIIPLIQWVSISKIPEIFKVYYIEKMIFGIIYG